MRSATGASSIATSETNDVFLTKATGATVKISAQGVLAWSRPYGSVVAAAPNERVVVAGELAGTIDLDGVALTSKGGTDVFVAKIKALCHVGVPARAP